MVEEKAPEQGEPKIPSDAQAQGEITIDLEAKKSGEKIEDSAKAGSPSVNEELVKMQRRMEYQARQYEKSLREMKEIAQSLQQAKQAPSRQVNEPDDLDKVFETDYKKGIRILAQEEAKRILDEERKAIAKELEESSFLEMQERSKATVLKKHPELVSDENEKAEVYRQVINEDQSLVKNPHGPEIAMYRMEERLRTLKPTGDQSVDREVERRLRTQSAYAPQGRQPSQTGKISMSVEEQQYCINKGIPFEQYAKMKQLDPNALKQGVSVQ